MAKAVSFTQTATAPIAGLAPEALLLVGDLPDDSFPSSALPATPASFADLAAARTAVEALRAALVASPYFNGTL
jgi:hypothetical protein